MMHRLRLRVKKPTNFKMVKWIREIRFVETEEVVGKEYGGTNEDRPYFDLLPYIERSAGKHAALLLEKDVVAEFARFGDADAGGRKMWAQFSIVHQVLDMNVVQEERRIGYQPSMTAPPESFRA